LQFFRVSFLVAVYVRSYFLSNGQDYAAMWWKWEMVGQDAGGVQRGRRGRRSCRLSLHNLKLVSRITLRTNESRFSSRLRSSFVCGNCNVIWPTRLNQGW